MSRSRPQGHRRAVVSGSLWSSLQTVTSKTVSLATTLIMAWVLVAEDYGLANIATGLGAALIMLPPFAMTDVLVSRPHRFDQRKTLAFREAMYASLLNAGVVVAAGMVAEVLFHSRDIATLLLLVALRPIGDGLMVVPMSRLRIEMRFREIALADLVCSCAGSAIGLLLAFFGAGPTSLVLPPIISIFIRALWYWRVSVNRTPPTFVASRKALDPQSVARQFRHAALVQYISNALFMSEPIVLLAFASSAAQGYFGLAFTLANQTNYLITSQVGQILQPVFAVMNSERDRQTAAYARALVAVSLFAIPACLIQVSCARSLLPLLLGDKWDLAVAPFVALCFGQVGICMAAPTVALLKARGAFGRLLMWQFSHAAAAVALLPLVAMRLAPVAQSACEFVELPCDAESAVSVVVCAGSAILWLGSALAGAFIASSGSRGVRVQVFAKLALIVSVSLLGSVCTSWALAALRIDLFSPSWLGGILALSIPILSFVVSVVVSAASMREGRTWLQSCAEQMAYQLRLRVK